jgi:adenylate kinase family enzyme
LVRDHDCHHISVGDLLRNMRNEPKIQSIDVEYHIQAGRLVPTAAIVDILKYAIMKVPDDDHNTIVDGFPRRLDHGIAAEAQARDITIRFSTTC